MPHTITALLLSAELPESTILSFDMNLIIGTVIQILNILVLSGVLIFILYKPVRKFMAARTERIRGEIEEARSERAEALELKEQYEKLIADIEQEREEILHQAYKKAMDKSDQMLFDARREAEVMYTRALAELETERQNVMDEMKRQMIEISVMMAGKFVEVSIDRATQDKYIDQALAEWEES